MIIPSQIKKRMIAEPKSGWKNTRTKGINA